MADVPRRNGLGPTVVAFQAVARSLAITRCSFELSLDGLPATP